MSKDTDLPRCTAIPLADEHLVRLYREIPESRRGQLDPSQLARARRLIGEG